LGLAAAALLRAKAEPLFELEADARSGADVDAVHDMRVASRRLREAMRLLAPLYPQAEFGTWYRRVRRVTRMLGPVRDSDVFIEDFSRLGRDLGEGGKQCVAFMAGYRSGQRERELEVLDRQMHKLDLSRSRREFERLTQFVADTEDAWRPLAEFAHEAVAERAATVFAAQPAALDAENLEQQHALRIDYKRLRYAVEAFAPCYGNEFDALHGTLTAFQDTLGEMHDLHVFMEMLRAPDRIAAAARADVTAEDIGEVEALLERRAIEKHRAFVKLAEKHPPEKLLPALLLPLSQGPGKMASPRVDTVEAPAEGEPESEQPAPPPEPAPEIAPLAGAEASITLRSVSAPPETPETAEPAAPAPETPAAEAPQAPETAEPQTPAAEAPRAPAPRAPAPELDHPATRVIVFPSVRSVPLVVGPDEDEEDAEATGPSA
jgi:CHAD domain-containing protein